MKIRHRDDWEVTDKEIVSFLLDCLNILMAAFGFFAGIVWRALKFFIGMAIAAGLLYGLWRLGVWLFFVVFGW